MKLFEPRSFLTSVLVDNVVYFIGGLIKVKINQKFFKNLTIHMFTIVDCG